MNDIVTFDVVIPVYSAQGNLSVSVRSALASTAVKRLILVASNKQEQALALAESDQDDRIRVILEPTGASQALAAGIAQCTADWVAFIAPGDAFASDYFEVASHFIEDDFRLGLIFTHLVSESSSVVHPLNHRFEQGTRAVELADTDDMVARPLFGTLISKQTLTKSGMDFNPLVRDGYDRDFMVRLFLNFSCTAGILAEAEYRFTDQSPTIATLDLTQVEAYSRPFEMLYLPWAETAESKRSSLPSWLQNTILVDIYSYLEVERGPDHPARSLPEDLRVWGGGLLAALLGYMDADLLERFNLKPLTLQERMMLMSHCAQSRPGLVVPKVWVKSSQLGRVRSFSYFWRGADMPSEELRVDQSLVTDTEGHWISHCLLGVELVRERRLLVAGSGSVDLTVDGQHLEISDFASEQPKLSAQSGGSETDLGHSNGRRFKLPVFPEKNQLQESGTGSLFQTSELETEIRSQSATQDNSLHEDDQPQVSLVEQFERRAAERTKAPDSAPMVINRPSHRHEPETFMDKLKRFFSIK